jgi:DNA-directed RNA polymerase specialized sigma54-like protein
MKTGMELMSSDHYYAIVSSLRTLRSVQTSKTSTGDIASESSVNLMRVVEEYVRLNSRLNRLSTEDEDLIDEILQTAQENPLLEFWLSEADHILRHQQGDLDEDAREFYKDQHAILHEYIGLKDFQFVIPPPSSENCLGEQSSTLKTEETTTPFSKMFRFLLQSLSAQVSRGIESCIS